MSRAVPPAATAPARPRAVPPVHRVGDADEDPRHDRNGNDRSQRQRQHLEGLMIQQRLPVGSGTSGDDGKDCSRDALRREAETRSGSRAWHYLLLLFLVLRATVFLVP